MGEKREQRLGLVDVIEPQFLEARIEIGIGSCQALREQRHHDRGDAWRQAGQATQAPLASYDRRHRSRR